MEFTRTTWLYGQIMFAFGMVFQRAWETNDALKTLSLAVAAVVSIGIIWCVMWVFDNFTVRRKKETEEPNP